MRKVLIALLALLAMSMSGEEFKYLNFTLSDNTVVSLAANGLEITFADGNLVAVDADGGTTTISLTNLASMEFSNSTSGVADVAGVTECARGLVGDIAVNAHTGATVTVIDVNGVTVAQTVLATSGEQALGLSLSAGVYLVKIDALTIKVLVQ